LNDSAADVSVPVLTVLTPEPSFIIIKVTPGNPRKNILAIAAPTPVGSKAQRLHVNVSIC